MECAIGSCYLITYINFTHWSLSVLSSLTLLLFFYWLRVTSERVTPLLTRRQTKRNVSLSKCHFCFKRVSTISRLVNSHDENVAGNERDWSRIFINCRSDRMAKHLRYRIYTEIRRKEYWVTITIKSQFLHTIFRISSAPTRPTDAPMRPCGTRQLLSRVCALTSEHN